jgi:regulatory protein
VFDRESEAGSVEVAELEAAATYARRRRLGPHRRDPEARAERRERDLAALARAGFSYAIAQQIIDADPAPEA